MERFCHEKRMESILDRAQCCRRPRVHAERGLIIMINCQSVQVFEWLVVGENHHDWWTFTVFGWLRACWTPYQNGHHTPLLLCYIVALLHTTSSKFWCLSRLLFVTKYYQQDFSQHRRQAKCTEVLLQIVELFHSHTTWLLVDTKSKIPLLNHQNRVLHILVKDSTSVCELLV